MHKKPVYYSPVRNSREGRGRTGTPTTKGSPNAYGSPGGTQLAENRVPEGYSKVSVLGKGLTGTVYSAVDVLTKESVAIKQIEKTCKHGMRAGSNEIAMNSILFKTKYMYSSAADDVNDGASVGGCSNHRQTFGGVVVTSPKAKFLKHVGTGHCAEEEDGSPDAGAAVVNRNVIRLIKCVDTLQDMFLIFEKGGKTITSLCFEIKGEFYNGERVYQVRHLEFYNAMRTNIDIFKRLIKDLLSAVKVFSSNYIVHADLKPDNILVDYCSDDLDRGSYNALKIIDFGSSYHFMKPHKANSSTPEYLPPEVIKCNASTTMGDAEFIEALRDNSKPHSLDVWSIGAIFLEVASGFPLWFAYKSYVSYNNQKHWIKGIFADNGRRSEKILQKQSYVQDADLLNALLLKYPGLGLHGNGEATDLLKRLLDPNPRTRISPEDAMNHAFFASIS